MGKINICVKRAFIFVCVLIGIISTLLLAITLFGHGFFHKAEGIGKFLPVIVMMYVLEAATLVLSIFGGFGACKEKKWAVVLFSVGMSLASLYLLVECVRVCVLNHKGANSMSQGDSSMSQPCCSINSDMDCGLIVIKGICIALTALWDIGVALAITILCQMRRNVDVISIRRAVYRRDSTRDSNYVCPRSSNPGPVNLWGVLALAREKKWAVVLFSVGMSLASLYLFVECVRAYESKHEMEELTRDEYLAMMPLSRANTTDIKEIYNIQTNFKCCGLVQGYQDWGTDIPISCLCSDEDSTDFKCVARGNNTIFVIHYPNSDKPDDRKRLMDEHMLVYEEPCLPILISVMGYGLILITGIFIALTALWDIGVALAITILCQMRRKFDVPPVIFTSQPPQYRELCDTAENV
ncbi:uncharacterized protein LOC121543341 [Coregonus clupeaformis]|uniref:uncharacterized protein LOC121543341 n=1 Tax=Coregonus clupeaformis TaxID=59861 RepID=UPI001E1C72AD|nr:uncharacterized protein LOC121543341 [Coregonus clupeaformis]